MLCNGYVSSTGKVRQEVQIQERAILGDKGIIVSSVVELTGAFQGNTYMKCAACTSFAAAITWGYQTMERKTQYLDN